MATMNKFNNQIMQFACSAVSSGLLADVHNHAVSPTTHNIDNTSSVSVSSIVSTSGSRTIIVSVSSPTTLIKENLDIDPPNINFQKINETVLQLFKLIEPQVSALQIDINLPLIITGVSLGGSVATLITQRLLDTNYLKASRKPLCITFGSPLLGDDAFRKAISEGPSWISCFLNVISNKDLLALGDNYMPFGTTLILSESGCACFDEPQPVLDVIKAMSSGHVGLDNCDYGVKLKRLERNVIRKPQENVKCDIAKPLEAGIALQLLAIGAINKEEMNSGKSSLVKQIKESLEAIQKRKMSTYDTTKGFNDTKVCLARMEYYKRVAEDGGGCYYDSFKTVFNKAREEIVKNQRVLTQYWKRKVNEMEKTSKVGTKSNIPKRWLHGGTNYKRMVEPFEIAEYYQNGSTGYIDKKRCQHFKVLDEWEKAIIYKPNEKNKVSSLTNDSCFWAHVEEALIALNLLMNGGQDREPLIQRLLEFEVYVMGLINKLSVSVDIFNEKSSFMTWWKKYKEMKTTSYNSELMAFMNNEKLENGGFTLDEYKKMT